MRKTSCHDPTAIVFVFQVTISCKTPSIILYFKYAPYIVVRRKKLQNTNPHPDGSFFVDCFGLGILREEYICVFHTQRQFYTLLPLPCVAIFLPPRFWESRDHPQPGSFLSRGSKREDPGIEVEKSSSHSNSIVAHARMNE